MKPEERQALAVDNDSLRMGEATRTLTGDHESRVSDTRTSIVQSAGFMIGPSAKAGSIGAQMEESPTLDTNGTKGVAVGIDPYNTAQTGSVAATLGVNAGMPTGRNAVALNQIVRRLTPGECEMLQGFPRDWTKIPYRGKPTDQCPDSPRYKALGNSWATNCAEWILRRIAAAFRLGMISPD